MPVVYESDYDYQIGKADILRPISRLTIVSHGTTVGHALKAVSELEDTGIQIGLVNMHTIKPIDENVLDQVLRKSDHVLVFEEHTVIGGLGSAIIEYANDRQIAGVSVRRYGAKDNFPRSGSYEYMLDTLGLNTAGIKRTIHEVLNCE